jgi:hypothetical protein
MQVLYGPLCWVLWEPILCWVMHQMSLLMAVMLGKAPSDLIMDVGCIP